MVMGRPQEYNRVKIAEEIIEWAKLPDSINLNKFCAYHDPIIPATTMLNWVREDPDFRKAYECARMFLASRREEWLNGELLHVKAYDLNATVYDQFLKCEKREQAEFESNLKKEENDNIPPLQQQINLSDTLIKQQARIAELEAQLANKQ